ncbi:MAG: hypothetical protein GXO78_04055 [Calditrichaeota bacterium]|nr:hypothetical protein [Calditrichota bacterium]
MYGNNKKLIIKIIICIFVIASNINAGNRIPGKDFRIGVNMESGLKIIGPSNFHGKIGIQFKIKEKTTLIPYIGIYPDQITREHQYEEYNPRTGRYVPTTVEHTYNETILDAGLTIRFEKLREIVLKSTAFEYDYIEQKFLKRYYYKPFRRFFQFHFGTFFGIGTGFLYYFSGNFALGVNTDVGYNLLGEKGFGVSFKLIISTGI